MMDKYIKTRKELFEELDKTKESALDKLIVWKVSEDVLREIKKELLETNEFIFTKINNIDDRLDRFEKITNKKDYEINRLKKARDEWKKIVQKEKKLR